MRHRTALNCVLQGAEQVLAVPLVTQPLAAVWDTPVVTVHGKAASAAAAAARHRMSEQNEQLTSWRPDSMSTSRGILKWWAQLLRAVPISFDSQGFLGPHVPAQQSLQ